MPYGETTSAEVERVAKAIVDATFKVHHELGPGLLESIYLACLEYELKKCGFLVERQVTLPVYYDGQKLDTGLRMDLVVDRLVLVEGKSVERMLPVFEAQALTYLKLSGLPLAFLINFNVALIKDGIKRVILSRRLRNLAEPDQLDIV